MSKSNSVLRRYTPPTCTLEIMAPSSQINQVHFDLGFDDPRVPEEKRVNIQGDRDQLEALHQAVTTYVQYLLAQSPDRFNAILPAVASPSTHAPMSSTPAALDLSGDDSQALSQQPRRQESTIGTPTGKILLQPGSGLSHDLFLGPLATQETGPVIQLSLLQLFDLATALDEYAADVVAMPAFNRTKSASAPPAWATIAAVVLLSAGLTTAVVQLLDRSDSEQQTANKSATPRLSSNSQQPIALQPSPVPTLSPPLPPLSSPETLPSLPPVGSTAPLLTPSSQPVVTLPRTAPALPSAPQAVPTPTPSENALRTPKENQKGTASSASPPQVPSVNIIPPITPAPPITINPAPKQDRSVFLPGEPAVPGTMSGETKPSFPVTPPSATTPSPSPFITTPNPDLEATLSEAGRGAASRAESRENPALQQSPDASNLGERLRQGRQTQSRSTPTTPDQPTKTAFDTIPQVAEAREYFKQRWEPPSGLQQDLEYSLLLDIDGTIQRIEPLGQASRDYIDRTGMPLIGESFVSPSRNGQIPRIRVVLTPDGKVQTFLESASSS